MVAKFTGQGGIERRQMLGLAGVAVAAFAGCTESAGSSGDPASAATASTSGAATAGTETATGTDRSTATDTPEESATETESADEHAEASGREHSSIESARESLATAHRRLVAQGDGDGLTGLTAANYPVRTDEVLAAVDRARIHVETAQADVLTAEQRGTVEDLATVATFLETMARGQKDMSRAHWRLDDHVPDLFFDGSAATLADRLDAAVWFAERVETSLDDLPSDVDTRAARSFEPLDAAAVSDKLDQMRTAISAIDAIHDAFDPALTGLELLRDGTARYEMRRYATAMSEYGDAADEFGTAVAEFESLSLAEPFAATVEGMTSATEVLEVGCNELADAAAASADGADTLADRHIAEAHEAFDTHDDVPSIPAIDEGPSA
ncbi:hypothetical protein ACOZ4N_10500 [Halorientalis pallida]|uniref:hypothetical protein n=1 Tax=Halorientalis pallida TaxID=2479928 RepID=UPI003C6FA6C9